MVSTFVASQDYEKALAGAILTIGGYHAPVKATMSLLSAPDAEIPRIVDQLVKNGQRLPGWGNSFHKGSADPLWKDVDEALQSVNRELHERISTITTHLHVAKKIIFPNAACYTAATALTLNMPMHVASYLVIAPRIEVWTSMLLR